MDVVFVITQIGQMGFEIAANDGRCGLYGFFHHVAELPGQVKFALAPEDGCLDL